MRRIPVLPLVFAVVLGGCEDKPRPKRSTEVPTPSAASATPAATGAAPGDTTVTLHAVARADGPMEMIGRDEALVLSGRLLYRTEKGRLLQDWTIMEGLFRRGVSDLHLTGVWPYAAVAYLPGQGGTLDEMAACWERTRWSWDGSSMYSESTNYQVPGGGRWGDLCVLALWGGSKGDWSFKRTGSNPGGPPTPGGAPKADDGVLLDRNCMTRIVPRAMTSSPDGHLFAVGRYCPSKDKVLVQHWFPRATEEVPQARQAKFDELPSPPPDGNDFLLEALSGTDAYVGMREPAYLVHLEGTSWTKDEVPGSGPLTGLSVSSSGKLWAIAGGQLFVRPKAGRWESVSLPDAPPGGAPWDPLKVVARADGAPWVIAKSGKNHWLLGPKPAGPVAEMPQVAPSDHGGLKLVEASSLCPTPVVLLAVGEQDAKNPALAKALASVEGLEGVQYITFSRAGTKLLGAKVPSYEVGRRMVDALERKGTRLICHATADEKPASFK